jgi:hypothetical protein
MLPATISSGTRAEVSEPVSWLEEDPESHAPGTAGLYLELDGTALTALMYMLSASSWVKTFDAAKSSFPSSLGGGGESCMGPLASSNA